MNCEDGGRPMPEKERPAQDGAQNRPNSKANDPENIAEPTDFRNQFAESSFDYSYTAGRSVLWGDPSCAPHIVITEGIETGAAVALACQMEIEAGAIAVAA